MTRRGRQPDDATGLGHAADRENAKDPESNALLSYVRRRFPRVGLAVTLLVGAAVALGFIVTGVGNIKTLAGWLLPAKPALPYVEIVFDRPQDMNAHLGNDPATKWIAAWQALQHIDLSDNEYIGLRTFGGGPCPPKSGPLDLRFTRDGKGWLDSTLLALQPGGQGNFADSVIAAIDDFMNGIDFGPTKPRVVVIAGGNDDCTGDYVGAIKSHLAKYPNASSIPSFLSHDSNVLGLECRPVAARRRRSGQVDWITRGSDAARDEQQGASPRVTASQTAVIWRSK